MMGVLDVGRDLKSLCWRRMSEVDEPFGALFGGLGHSGLHTYGPTWGLAWGRQTFFRGREKGGARKSGKVGKRGEPRMLGERRFE